MFTWLLQIAWNALIVLTEIPAEKYEEKIH